MKDKKEEAQVMSTVVEPTGIPLYKHDLYNMTDKEKARQILDEMLLEYLDKGGAIKILETKK